MNVQPSVMIWTAICFCLFMLVMDKLLFKPVLKVLDERRAKVEGARALAAEKERERKEAELRLEEERRLEAARLLEERNRLYDERRAEAARELEEYSRRAEERTQDALRDADKLSAEADSVLGAAMDSLAEAFAEKLLPGGRG